MFKNIIVKKPAKSMVDGISNADLGKPDYEKAVKQHEKYIEALKTCGVKVKVLEAEEKYPDSCFVEDPALVTKKCAIITNLGADSRKGEEKAIYEALKEYFPEDKIEKIKAPGTIEGGDIMMVGDHFYIGLSARTNKEGADQMIEYLEKYGFTASTVELEEVLHLKTGLAYLENNNLLAAGEFVEKDVFQKYNIIEISEDESYAANCIWVNGKVIVPEGFENAEKKIRDLGYDVIVLDVSEFRKLDGGLSCLSLRF